MFSQQNVFHSLEISRPFMPIRLNHVISNKSSSKKITQSNKLELIPTRAPKILQNYAVDMARTTGVTLQSIYQEGAKRFIEESPWENGLDWKVTEGLAHKVNGENQNTGWMQVNVKLSTDICNQIEHLVTEQKVSRSAVVYTMMYWWIVCPPEDEHFRRHNYYRAKRANGIEPLKAEDLLNLQVDDTDISSTKKTKSKNHTMPKKDFDRDQIVQKYHEITSTYDTKRSQIINLGLFFQETIEETGVAKAEIARILGRSPTWVGTILAKASFESLGIAERINVPPEIIGAGDTMRMLTWAKDEEKYVVLDAIAAEIGTGRAYNRALLNDEEERYEIRRYFPSLSGRTDLSLDDLRWIRLMFQSDDEVKKKAAMMVIDGGSMPEEQLISAVDDATDANNLITEASKELSDKDMEILELKEQTFTQAAKISALQSQIAMRSPESKVPVCSDELKTFFEASLSKSGSLVLLLDYLKSFYGDRVVILESAFRSAKDSDDAGFEPKSKAADLLFKLAGVYVQRCREGMHSSVGIEVFGNKCYAPSEGARNNISGVMESRTFSEYVMMEHLKIDGGRSMSQTLRIHFKYDSDIEKVVIGHCGPHLS